MTAGIIIIHLKKLKIQIYFKIKAENEFLSF